MQQILLSWKAGRNGRLREGLEKVLVLHMQSRRANRSLLSWGGRWNLDHQQHDCNAQRWWVGSAEHLLALRCSQVQSRVTITFKHTADSRLVVRRWLGILHAGEIVFSPVCSGQKIGCVHLCSWLNLQPRSVSRDVPSDNWCPTHFIVWPLGGLIALPAGD